MYSKKSILLIVLLLCNLMAEGNDSNRQRVIVTTDGEIDDRASMVRFLLSSNEFDVEGIINSSSQFHWVGGTGWNEFHPVEWIREYIGYYSNVYDNLLLHDSHYPSPDYLLEKWHVGNISAIGEYESETDGAKYIAECILDETDNRPIWIQAWGGCNTIASALKIIETHHSDKMEYAASKIRLYLIWEQDQSYQEYIRPKWEKYNIPTIISDQFDCMAYIWDKVLPDHLHDLFRSTWIHHNILDGKGPLCAAYPHNTGNFNAEGDTPAFLHVMPTGLRSTESPDYGGWGGRYINVRNNIWMDIPPTNAYQHPSGKYGFENSWSKMMENWSDTEQIKIRSEYFRPLWRWLEEIQNDFAARANWCVKDYDNANHHPIVTVNHKDLYVMAGDTITLDASNSYDPDCDGLEFSWWFDNDINSKKYAEEPVSNEAVARISIPDNVQVGENLHVVCTVKDNGVPALSRHQRVILHVIG